MDAFSIATLNASKLLQSRGFTTTQAEALAELQKSTLGTFVSSRQLATKKDSYELKVEMYRIKADTIRRLVGSAVALGAFLVAILAWLK